MDPLTFLAEHSTSIWGAASGVASGVGMFLLSLRRVNASLDRARMKMTAEASVAETAERAAFRASLMGELTDMRLSIKECEGDKNSLRERLNNTEAQILVLKAANEIMEKWVTFFRDGTSPRGPAIGKTSHSDLVQ